MALIDDFKTRFPEFPTATVDSYFPVLEEVWPAYYNTIYQASTKEAVLNLVAHLLVGETSTSSGATGTTQSKSAGGVSVSYAVPQNISQMQAMFGSTKYGQRFMLLTRRNYGGVAV